MSLIDLGKKLLDSARLGQAEDVRLMMGNGAPFTTDWLGASPLHLASQCGHIETVEILIRAGISRDARTKVDRTSLHLAAQEGQIEIVELLLKSGADIDAKDMLRMTPLHWAVERGHISTVELLLKSNADVNAVNKFDKLPSDIAVDNNYSDIYKLIQNYSVLKVHNMLKNTKDYSRIEMVSSASKEILPTSATATNYVKIVNNNDSRSNKNIDGFHRKSSSNSQKTNLSGLKIIQQNDLGSDSPEQTSTSVLATLAALAEATASKTGNSSEASNWLEAHGIAMLPVDNSTVVSSALESGQNLSLTEAGKLALNWGKSPSNGNGDCADSENQKVITIVTDPSQLSSIVGNSSNSNPILLMSSNRSEPNINIKREAQTIGASSAKKARMTVVTTNTKSPTDDVKKEIDEKEELQKQLEEARKAAEEFKAQLQKKEHEAEGYKKKLDEMSKK